MSIIKNFGFLWERKYIYAGTGGADNAGHLKGEAKGKPIADFCDQIGVYVLYDKNQSIVYIGQAGNGNATLFTRLRNHMKGTLWNRWEYFSWIGFKAVNSDGSLDGRQQINKRVNRYTYSNALDEIEGILIEIIEPKLNKQGGKLKNATEYFQFVDPRVGDVLNSHLLDQLEKIEQSIKEISVN